MTKQQPAHDGKCDLCGDSELVERMEYGAFKGNYLCVNCQELAEEEGLGDD